MKKIIVGIIAVLYMGVSSGIAMDIHYCMGKKAGTDFYGTAKAACGKCGMKEKKGCCQDDHQFYKLNDSHKNVSNTLSFETPVTIVEHSFAVYQPGLIKSAAKNEFNNHSPPVYSGPSACIMYCIFRL